MWKKSRIRDNTLSWIQAIFLIYEDGEIGFILDYSKRDDRSYDIDLFRNLTDKSKWKMKVFIDTNVIVDALTKREPFYEDSLAVIKSWDVEQNEGFLAAHSLTNIYYLMRKDYAEDARRDVLVDLTEMFTIIGVEKEKLQAALKNKNFSDFEDGVQYECAVFCDVDVIVTRDVKHFENSQIKVITPHDFMNESESDEEE